MLSRTPRAFYNSYYFFCNSYWLLFFFLNFVVIRFLYSIVVVFCCTWRGVSACTSTICIQIWVVTRRLDEFHIFYCYHISYFLQLSYFIFFIECECECADTRKATLEKKDFLWKISGRHFYSLYCIRWSAHCADIRVVTRLDGLFQRGGALLSWVNINVLL